MKPVFLVTMILSLVISTHGHGRLTEPASRSTMWRMGYDNPANYNDNQLFCGGAQTQWGTYKGKCGVCGDSFAGPRDNEPPTGKYANGIIVKKYDMGQDILVRVHLTANHKGYFEFRLCENNVHLKNVTQECFDKNLLRDKTGATKMSIASNIPEHQNFTLELPPGVSCSACVFQWKYNTGNSWGVGEDGKGCVGCGPQEQFYGCADIAIGDVNVDVGDDNKPVNVPPGDVDERTDYMKEAEKIAAERKAEIEAEVAKLTGNCTCTCTSDGSSPLPSSLRVFTFTLLFISVTRFQ